jgi:hypothetical protein
MKNSEEINHLATLDAPMDEKTAASKENENPDEENGY